ncbi:MAG: hypothetical protein ACRD0Q_07835 [Acidimicrobiales bacterium]
MSHFDGDSYEMPIPPLDDRALEAVRGGSSSAGEGFAWLGAFVEDLGAVATRPVPVLRPALATLLAEGISTEKSDLSATAASNVTGPAPQAAGLPKWRRRMLISELLSGLAAKLAGLGMAAKAGMGLSLAAASVTAAGATGVLPGAAQHAVATVVSTATPFTFPDHASASAEIGATVSGDATGATDAKVGVDGKAVSDAAKAHGDAEGNAHSGVTGLDRANQTPAAGHVPTSVPKPAEPGSVTGLDRANETPAAGHVPTSVPASDDASSQGSTGVDHANQTPAADHIPANVPGRP